MGNEHSRLSGVIVKGGRLLAVGAMASALLAGCGGGGGPGASAPSAPLAGMAAAGAPISNGAGYALDAATGKTINFGTSANGTYTVNVAGYSGPFLLHVMGNTSAGAPVNLYSLAATSSIGGTLNITPLTDVVLGYAGGATPRTLETACLANVANCPNLLNSVLASLTSANTKVMNAIPSSVFTQFGLAASAVNAFSTPFSATHTGEDALLDVLVVAPAPSLGAGSYTLLLAGATLTPVASVPITGTAGAQSATAPGTLATPGAAALAQAANLVEAETETAAFMANFGALFATSHPTTTQVSPYIDINWLLDGVNRTAELSALAASAPVGATWTGGGRAPYSGAPLGTATTPAAAVTYDANNCVTSIWGYIVNNGHAATSLIQFKDAIPATNLPGVCTGGTWTMAGDGRSYTSSLQTSFSKASSGSITSYLANFSLVVDTAQSTGNAAAVNPWATVTVTGPGLATFGNQTATSGTVTLVTPPAPAAGTAMQAYASISDPYYGTATAGSNRLVACSAMSAGVTGQYGVAPTSATPCLSATFAGTDYTFKFLNAAAATLETDVDRLTVTPALNSVPASFFPAITGITPTMATSIPLTGSTLTINLALAPGTQNVNVGANLWGNTGAPPPTLFSQSTNIPVGATSATFSTGTLSTAPGGGSAYVSTYVGGFFLTSSLTF